MKPELNKTYSTFTNNDVIRRDQQVRRDNDTIRTPACTIYDVDYGIHWFISQYIQPFIVDNDARIDVPLYFANGEFLSQIQKNGYLREQSTGKIMTPVMTIRRASMDDREEYKHLDVNLNPADLDKPSGNIIIHKPKYTNKNQYDRFSTQWATKPSNEYYISSVPEYVTITYEILIWAEYIEQLNQIVQQIQPKSGHAWGDTWKFTTFMRGFTFEDSLDAGTDRVVRANVSIEVKAALLMPDETRTNNVKKAYSVKQVVFGTEVVNNIPAAPKGPNNQ